MPMGGTLNFCLLDGAFSERLRWADQEISVKINSGGWGYIFRPLCFRHTRFKPCNDRVRRRVIGLIFVVSSDLPNPQSAIAAIETSAAMKNSARLTSVNAGSD